MRILYMTIAVFILSLSSAYSEDPALNVCTSENKLCLLTDLEQAIAEIENERWRDTSYRELAKSYAYEGHEDKAIETLNEIKNPDTRALTIRGIGFAAADSKWDKEKIDQLFVTLISEAQKIDHPPSYGIALTYIAMAQAFAGDDAGATKTAQSMENDALRHKAFGETAEIQAERGDYAAAIESISYNDSLPFRNKAHRIISKIFVKRGQIQDAYAAAMKIENAYMKAQALQRIVNVGNPEEEIGRDE